ncbi:gamma-glutamyltransferase [Rhodobacterales bacterium 52_120_T64]|nr:gamma-glutamyltransferase [Rhodobacterales bacterium 52_120_T64]
MRNFSSPGRSTVIASNGMCATSHPLAAKIAIQMLEQGGNAVDAAIAAAMILNIAEPQMTGLGGDCFVLVKPAGVEEIIGLNGSGRSPAALNSDDIRARHTALPAHGVEAVTVPGAVDAMVSLSSEFGKLDLKTVLAPAIHYAQQGIPVAARTAFDWQTGAAHLQGVAKDFYLLNGQIPVEGQVFRAPQQAEVLRRIAMEGRAGFYEGEVAEDMVASLNALGGCHTMEDFAKTACNYVEPITGMYRGMELVELPPNGQGATAILLGNILEQFDLSALDSRGAQRAHIEAEAAKLAYDARNRFIADPDHQDVRLAHMLSQETAKQLAAMIDINKAMDAPAALTESVHKETVYLTVVDRDRMAVSLIYSIFHSFGSGMASDKFGILYQNRGAGFTLDKGHPNEAAGSKRPMHTIIPAMLKKDGKVIMPFGVMGGQYQSTGHMRMVSNIVDYGMSPQESMDTPRSFAEAGELRVEDGYSEQVRADLEALGHNVNILDKPLGGAQAIWIDEENGVLHGASDPRKDGCAIGY